ncbi:MAG: tRNA (adenosine(37)-N6)-dimethylallyltransferase MiaA [Myxococcales bacterium]|nr:tRNA (adenosine(37)-N6)-dimethylallyltransferase MiaA [Myxococcales bacterium]
MAAAPPQPSADAPRPRVVILTGPTASGKTPIAIELAKRFDGEIVNADSMQVFRYMDIGTAKPSPEQQAAAVHHMIDVVTPDSPYNAGRFANDARTVLSDIHARGKVALLTGGTGLYIRAVTEGLLGDVDADPGLRAELEAEHEQSLAEADPHRLHRRLASVDPKAAAAIHPNDVRRVVRALEIHQQSGSAASKLRDDHDFCERPYRTLHLAIDPGREVLKQRIDARCRAMLDAGLLKEVRALRQRRFGPELRPMQAIGYRHMNAVADGHDILENALEAMQRDTRHFARRQRTWLRAIPDVRWRHPEQLDALFAEVDEFLTDD